MAMEFKVGDIVRLKSGGPKMTIVKPAVNKGDFYATWFAGSKKESGIFPAESLDTVKDEPSK